MIPLDRALKTVLDSARELDTETVSLHDAAERVLAQDIISDMDMPPFCKSAMDGYAYSSKDRSEEFAVIETVQAGSLPEHSIKAGECAKIMTGAPVPAGADRVVRVVYTEETNGIMKITAPETGSNICVKGEDFTKGDILLSRAARITPAIIGVCASAGYAELSVYRKPRVAIIATGSEIVEPSEKPGQGQIRNSNSYQLYAQVLQCGGHPSYLGIAGDTREEIDSLFTQALGSSDIVLLSGGVSMGDYDFVPDILEAHGVDVLFSKIAVKPGKPTVFGIQNSVYIFGLPGNPVSTLVIFELLVKPLIACLSGFRYTPSYIKGELTQDIRTKKSKRQKCIPVRMENGLVTPAAYHGSAHILAYTEASGIICLAGTGERYSRGDTVDVRQI